MDVVEVTTGSHLKTRFSLLARKISESGNVVRSTYCYPQNGPSPLRLCFHVVLPYVLMHSCQPNPSLKCRYIATAGFVMHRILHVPSAVYSAMEEWRRNSVGQRIKFPTASPKMVRGGSSRSTLLNNM